MPLFQEKNTHKPCFQTPCGFESVDVGVASSPLHKPRQKWQMRQLTLMVEQKLREDEEAELELQGLGAVGGGLTEETGGRCQVVGLLVCWCDSKILQLWCRTMR